MREPVGYREQIELLTALYPGQVALTIKQVCSVLNRDRRTLLKDKTFPAKLIDGEGKYIIPMAPLARKI